MHPATERVRAVKPVPAPPRYAPSGHTRKSVVGHTVHGLRAFLDAWHTTDCTTALRTLGATVTEPERYDRIETDSLSLTPQPDGTVDVDTCGVRWQDNSLPFFTGTRAPVPHYGPAPGRLRVAPRYRVAWQITDYQLPEQLDGRRIDGDSTHLVGLRVLEHHAVSCPHVVFVQPDDSHAKVDVCPLQRLDLTAPSASDSRQPTARGTTPKLARPPTLPRR